MDAQTIDWRLLQAFLAAAETGSLGAAHAWRRYRRASTTRPALELRRSLGVSAA